jgi:hypothetical protein
LNLFDIQFKFLHRKRPSVREQVATALEEEKKERLRYLFFIFNNLRKLIAILRIKPFPTFPSLLEINSIITVFVFGVLK